MQKSQNNLLEILLLYNINIYIMCVFHFKNTDLNTFLFYIKVKIIMLTLFSIVV